MAVRSHANGRIFVDIRLSDVEVSPENVRHEQTDKELDDLANSSEKHGLLQPSVLRGRLEGGPSYALNVAQRRCGAYNPDQSANVN